MLLSVGTDILFFPPVEEVYPPGVEIDVPADFGSLDQVMEGAFRPGHFAGVARVVRRLLDIVQPQRLYMGQKDYQQFTIIQHLIDETGLPVGLVRCPIVREADGLAMSSRNTRLSPEARRQAPAIYRILQEARRALAEADPEVVERWALQQLKQAGLRPEYFEIVDGRTLEPLEKLEGVDSAVACVAAWAGDVRLIDNVILAENGRPVSP
jgi:pantoate--beta-alanine ligase